jgi:hypothetical protein
MQGSPLNLNSIIRSGPLLRGSTTRVVAVVDRPGRPENVPCLWGAAPGPTICHTSRGQMVPSAACSSLSTRPMI